MEVTNSFKTMRQRTFTWCEYSSTIRLWPGNYCIAVKTGGRLVLDIDHAVNLELATKIFQFYHIDMNSWLQPVHFAESLNKLILEPLKTTV